MRQRPVYVLNHSHHNLRQRTTQADLDEIEDWTDRAARRMYEGAGLGPKDVDIFDPYDSYAPMAQFFLEAFEWHGVKRGDAFAFYAGDIRVEGPHPFSSSGGNLGSGRTRTAMYTDSIEQLRGTAGARQVRGFGQRLRWRHSPRQAVPAGSCSAKTRADGL
jgi:Thiolase C-terminal domain-like